MYRCLMTIRLGLMLAGCAAGNRAASEPTRDIALTPTLAGDSLQPLPGNIDGVAFFEDNQEYTIRSLLPRDGIRPIYDPKFTSPEDSNLQPEELVMGVEINGDARAYPVGVLRGREMVNDEIGGTPVLVTW